jgi:hypothetical protein
VHLGDFLTVEHPTPHEFDTGVKISIPSTASLTYPARAKTNGLARGHYYDPDDDFVPRELRRKPVPKPQFKECDEKVEKTTNKASKVADILFAGKKLRADVEAVGEI